MKTCIRGLLLFAVVLSTAAGAQAGPRSGVVNLVDQTWFCNSPVDLDSVTVTVTPASKQEDAIHLGNGCTGRIGTIDILIQTLADGIKIGEGAHDLAIDGGTIRCVVHRPLDHQDGVQAMASACRRTTRSSSSTRGATAASRRRTSSAARAASARRRPTLERGAQSRDHRRPSSSRRVPCAPASRTRSSVRATTSSCESAKMPWIR
jgi:hypothetical protein